MKIPQYEDTIDNVTDLVEHNITLFEYDYLFEDYRDWYIEFGNTSEWDHVANTMVPAARCLNGTQICSHTNGTWQHFIKYHLHGNKTHAIVRGYLGYFEFEVMPDRNYWWRSKKLEYGLNPYAGVLTSRNWILNEVTCSVQFRTPSE